MIGVDHPAGMMTPQPDGFGLVSSANQSARDDERNPMLEASENLSSLTTWKITVVGVPDPDVDTEVANMHAAIATVGRR